MAGSGGEPTIGSDPLLRSSRASRDPRCDSARAVQCVHDLRVVRTPAESPVQALVRGCGDHRIGLTTLNLGQLKMLQEVITLSVFVPFAVLYMRQPLRMDYLWAGLCLLGAVYFMFRR